MRPFPKNLFILTLTCCCAFTTFGQKGSSGEYEQRGGFRSDEEALGLKKSDSEEKENKVYQTRFLNQTIDATLGTARPADLDTLPLHFQNWTFPERNTTLGGEYLSNIGTPFLSKIFMDRTEKTPFLFGRHYEQWLTAPQEQIFYNTTTPYTNLRYLTTTGNDVSQEENFKFLFTANFNKYLNIGFDYEIVYARGFYSKNSNRDKLGNFFGNYRSPRYEAYWKASFNTIENYENGGITDDRYITNPLLMSSGRKEYESINIPVALTDAKSFFKTTHYFLNHRYNLGFERRNIVVKDSAKTVKNAKGRSVTTPATYDTLYTFIPVTSFIHTLYIDRGQRRYQSTGVNATFYNSHAYLDSKSTDDTCSLLDVRNTFGLSLVEGFHKWAQCGLTAFVEHDFRRYMRLQEDTSLHQPLTYHTKNTVWAGARLSRYSGEALHFDATGKICLTGENLGDFSLEGTILSAFNLWGKPVSLSADGSIRSDHPDYFLDNYVSNHFVWRNHFNNTYRTRIHGALSIAELHLEAEGAVENISNYIYFNQNAVPEQSNDNLQILTIKAKHQLGMGLLHWDNQVAYQLSSNQKVLPLPDVSAYSDLYLLFKLSKVLTSHIGIDCRYHTAYYAPAYMPATGQFYNQTDTKVGNYPFMNAYGNFHLKRMRFFVVYSHLSRAFVSPNYFSAPHYPLNPSILKVGLSWNFYD
jgi:hypothetical protein